MKNSIRVMLALALLAPSALAQPHPQPQATPPANTNPQPAQQQQPGPATPDRSLSAEQVTAQVQGFYDRTNDFESDFTQVSRNHLNNTNTTRRGHVRFKKPGRMRWDYSDPQGDVIVSNGSTLWAYEAAEHQAIQSNLQDSQLPSALSFLTGSGRLTNDFTVRLLDPTAYQYTSGYVLELTPITANPSISRLVFYVEPTNFQVARTVVLDAQGNRNRFDFRSPQVNNNPAQSVFEWSPPSGTQIVRP